MTEQDHTSADTRRAIRLAQAVLDSDGDMVKHVVREAMDQGRELALVLGGLEVAGALIDATGATNRAATQQHLDALILATIDD